MRATLSVSFIFLELIWLSPRSTRRSLRNTPSYELYQSICHDVVSSHTTALLQALRSYFMYYSVF